MPDPTANAVRAGETEVRSRVSPLLGLFLRPIHTVLMAVYLRVRVHHRHRLPSSGPVILTPTHRSRWDTLLLYCAVWGRLLRFLTTHDEFNGPQGWLIKRMGAFPINTRRPTPGALKHCRDILMDSQPLVIFPEGDIFRLPPGEVHPIKPGTAWLALQVQKALGDTPLTIVPIRLVFNNRFVGFRTRADVEIQEPLDVSRYAGLPRAEAIASLTADLQAAMGDRVNPTPKRELDASLAGSPPDVASAGRDG